MRNFIVNKQISIQAEPSKVWDALTNPIKTKQYFFNCEVFSDWKVGGPISFKGKIFWLKKIEMNGTIINIDPGKLLQYTLKNEHDKDNPNSFSTVTDELTYDNGKTTLSISDNVGNGQGAEERYKKSEKGWDKVLNGLKELVEENN